LFDIEIDSIYIYFISSRKKRKKTLLPARLQEDARLDLCINFDQVWKQTWSYPKQVLHRAHESGSWRSLLSSKRKEAIEHLQKINENKEQHTKRRRIRGLVQEVFTQEKKKCIYKYIYI